MLANYVASSKFAVICTDTVPPGWEIAIRNDEIIFSPHDETSICMELEVFRQTNRILSDRYVNRKGLKNIYYGAIPTNGFHEGHYLTMPIILSDGQFYGSLCLLKSVDEGRRKRIDTNKLLIHCIKLIALALSAEA